MRARVQFTLVLVVAAAVVSGQEKSGRIAKPLTIGSEGSFFIGGETKSLSGTGPAAGQGEVTVNQMYVQFQKPIDAGQHAPVVMVHGCCLTSATWETTPDGRMGWSEYFVRNGRSVYLADQVSRGRSGFDATIVNDVKAGRVPATQLPNVIFATRQTAWTVFRFGPSFGTAFPDGQFPIEAADELYKQMVPDLNAMLPMPNPTWRNMAALAVRLNGAVLMGHSESGFFPEKAALLDPSGVRGIVSIEMPCSTTYSDAQLAILAKIPTLVVFGDHLGDVKGGPANWSASFDSCQTFVQQVTRHGGAARMMHLPALGIHGNSHMLMQDRNNLQVADLVLKWLDEHVDRRRAARR